MSAQDLAINITPGEHTHWHLFGLTLNADTITATIVAGLIILILGFFIRRGASVRQPTKLQLGFETLTQQVEEQVEDTVGVKTAPWVVPFAMTLFLFILIANWLSVIPTDVQKGHPEYLPPPAADVNLTYALAVLVIGTLHVTGIKKRGLRGFYGHLFRKPRILIPLNILEEVIKPVTLSLRLFGNIFAGTIMVALIAAMPAFILWLPNVLWKLFDMFIGAIQAFIFALLSVIYLSAIRPQEGAH